MTRLDQDVSSMLLVKALVILVWRLREKIYSQSNAKMSISVVAFRWGTGIFTQITPTQARNEALISELQWCWKTDFIIFRHEL